MGNDAEAAQEKMEQGLSHTRNKLRDTLKAQSPLATHTVQLNKQMQLTQDYDDAKSKHSKFMEVVRWLNFPVSLLPAFLGVLSTEKGVLLMENIATSDFMGTQASTMVLMDELLNIIKMNSSKGELTVPAQQINELAYHIEELQKQYEEPQSAPTPG